MYNIIWKKRFFTIVVITTCLIGVCSFVFFKSNSTSANSQQENVWKVTGKKVRRANSKLRSRAVSPIVFKGKNISITQEEVKKQELLLSGENSNKKAENLLKARKTLYYQALKEGYSVSSKDIEG